MYLKFILGFLLSSIIAFPLYAQQSNVDEYVNDIQKELKQDISNIEKKSSESYYKPIEENTYKSSVEKNTGGDFSSYFRTIKEVNNNSVKFFINYYSTFGKRKLENIITRLTQNFSIINHYAKQYNVPSELSIIAFLESEFKPNFQMTDHVGTWNLSTSTAKVYGLTVNDYVDERRDLEKSTNVAFKYLLGLKEALNDNWEFIVASYNGGGAYINQKLRENYTSNFWDLVEKDKSFSNDSLEYVARFYALLTILKSPSRYNVNIPPFSDSEIKYDKVTISKTGVSFKDLAQLTSVPVNQLVAMNPQLTKQYTVNSANLYVPARFAKITQTRIKVAKAHSLRWIESGISASQNQYRVAKAKKAPVKRTSTSKVKYYSVAKKDTLSSIARRHNVTVAQLAKDNNMKPNSILKVGKVIKIASASSKVSKVAVAKKAVTSSSKVRVYSVKKGDTLFSIAKKYNVAINSIKTPSKTDLIRPGDKVIIA